ncbi:preprotein translocase subunit SecG [Candidatus Woesearchaeota archaeon]|jgi:preprotein translocase subunit SecG|nr:preprotein translocase subunit SecG [Candidatus Woesearchaeota archaeon]
MYQALTFIHVLVALAITGLVLLQQGRGADAGAGFGGASTSLFGARGASSFLSRTTAILATVFFVNSIGLSYLASRKDTRVPDIMESVTESARPSDLPVAIDEKAAGVPAADLPTEKPGK